MIHQGDCVEVMASMDEASVDAICTDPPYGLEFMGKEWDRLGARGRHSGTERKGLLDEMGFKGFREMPSFSAQTKNPKCRKCHRYKWDHASRKCDCAKPDWQNRHMGIEQEWFHQQWATAALRVAKPGAYLLAAGGTRTVHRLATAIEDAGWVIRDMIAWGYLSGFPKSYNVTQALLEAVPEDARCACAPRSSRIALGSQDGYRPERGSDGGLPLPAPGTARPSAPSLAGAPGRSRVGQRGDGLGLGLEHSLDPASSGPLSTAGYVLWSEHLSGRSPSADSSPSDTPLSTSDSGSTMPGSTASRTRHTSDWASGSGPSSWVPPSGQSAYYKCTSCGGWRATEGLGTALKPAFEPWVLARKPLGGSVAENVIRHGTGALNVDAARIGERWPPNFVTTDPMGDEYDRILMIPKASRSDREPLLPGELEEGEVSEWPQHGIRPGAPRGAASRRNTHPTVKPVELMRHLVRLVTPPGGTVLDPFTGSGSTLLAAEQEGFPWIGIEREAEYVRIAEQRLVACQRGLGLAV